MIGSTLAS
jgi:hypothetical protein